MRVVIRTPVLAPQFAALAERHGAEAVVVEDTEAMHRELADADALWTWPAFYDAGVVRVLGTAVPRLRWVQLPTMGYDPVELHGVPAGITVTTAGDAYAPTVAEHAVAMLLALVRHVPEAVRNAAGGRWDQTNARSIGTLHGATVAVLGFGNIGREVAARLRGFGSHVVAVTRSGAPDPLADESATRDRLHDVLGRSDAVVLAVPLNAATRHLIDARALAAMPAHAVLINVARGGVVDHAALRDALASGALGGAGTRRHRTRAAAGIGPALALPERARSRRTSPGTAAKSRRAASWRCSSATSAASSRAIRSSRRCASRRGRRSRYRPSALRTDGR